MQRQIGVIALTLAMAVPWVSQAGEPIEADYVIKGGLVVDGTGSPGKEADVAVQGDRIVAVGEFETGPDAKVIDAKGLIVAPGFIDLHSHSDRSIVRDETKNNLNFLRQGVTTVITGNCGSGPIDVAKYFQTLKDQGTGTNVIHLVPHGTLRRTVIGTADVRATDEQLKEMESLVEKGMEDGAWGMSTGLIYVPSRYGNTEELIDLARVVAQHGGIYASHIRGEGNALLNSINEAIRIGRESGAPAHISHLKATGRPNWGKLVEACQRIEAAREAGQVVTADQYPYIASSTSLGAMTVPDWALQGSSKDFAKIADDPEQGPKLRKGIERLLAERDGGAQIRISRYPKKLEWVGLRLTEIAEQEKTTPLEIVLEIQRNGGASGVSFGMSEEDVRFGMQQPFVATASDGLAHLPTGKDKPHPRSYGTFPRKIRYALDEKVITLEHAIHSASGLPAQILGMPDRGTIRVGSAADLVAFDPETFRDVATFDDPTEYATGVMYLFINGVPVIDDGEYQDKLIGRPLTPKDSGPASLILKTSRIWTGDPTNPWAEALAVRGGAIAAIGQFEDIERFQGSKTRLINQADAFALPGLIDAHGHLSALGSNIDELDLRGSLSPEVVADRVAQRIREQPGDGWILGRNWDQSLWPDMAFPTTSVLDAVAKDRPVWLRRVDGHAGWANSEALRRAGVTKETKAPSSGQILRDEQGNPTGVLVDGAMALVNRVVPPASKETIARRLLDAQEACLKVGLTGVDDAGLSPQTIAVLRELDRGGLLKLRVYGMASPSAGKAVEYASQPPKPRKPGDRFELRAIKLFIDGAMGSRGALLFEPYSDDPDNVGLQLITEDVLRQTTEMALRQGWQVATHAIGDKGNALVLDAYEAALKAVPEAGDPRLRIEHAQVVRREDVPRFLSLGLIASMQPSHASTDKRWADLRLGPGSERAQGAYAWRWFQDAGVPLAFGSDFPVEPPNPFWGLFPAITRQDAEGQPEGGWHPEQKLTIEEALQAFTQGAAFARFAEDQLGTLAVGHRADVTVIDRDLFQIEPAEVLKTQVRATIIEGEVVYEGGGNS